MCINIYYKEIVKHFGKFLCSLCCQKLMGRLTLTSSQLCIFNPKDTRLSVFSSRSWQERNKWTSQNAELFLYFQLELYLVSSNSYNRNIIPIMCICLRSREDKNHSRWTITTERFLAGLSCEGESPRVLWNEWLDWGLFSWLLWSVWSFLEED